MGRKGSWFSSVKKLFFISPSDSSKKEQKPHNHNHNHKASKLTCFGHHNYDDAEWKTGGVAPITIVPVPSLPEKKDKKPKKNKEEDEQNKQAFSLILATAVATGAAVAAAQAAAGTPRVKSIPRCYIGKSAEEIAAIKIQTAYRGYLARRTLRGLRGLARLKALVKGQSVQRQAATTLQCMQTLSRLQSQVSARKIRMSEENQSFQRQLQHKREREMGKLQAAQPIGEDWDYSSQSKEQIQAKLLNRQIAAMRREKALAYASTHQQTWRNSSKPTDATIMDPNNPHWGWNWLDRWMASRPWEGQTNKDQQNHRSAKGAASHTMSVGEISKLYAQRDQNQNQNQNQDNKNSPRSQKPNNSNLPSRIPSITKSGKTNTSSLKGGSWGGDDDSKINFNNKKSETNRRHSSIGVALLKDDEVNSPVKAKSKVQSPSAKKQLSFPAAAAAASPSDSRRHSVPPKIGVNSNKNVAATNLPEVKVKGKNGGSR
ncbi:protein IQ-domain 1-like [Trifolium pratense]|uniref:Protein IQ-domain 1-like n=2 Tax=Trifolium pratense TaxID=57577 RepID=A0A2K3MTH4_TRIPR|nr:protein IQ-domain 1-like [Trifolium pratense]CAJ2629659.1 unnamed protein product [Trifolium pratense]